MSSANDAWTWIDISVVHAIHEEQLAEHGGGVGLRYAGMLESALARPLQLAAHGEPDAAALAAAYGFGLAKNHVFVDGNKRTAFVTVELFLDLNGWQLTADDAACVIVMLGVASSDLDESAFADWLRQHIAPR